jgi:hypothetical protein
MELPPLPDDFRSTRIAAMLDNNMSRCRSCYLSRTPSPKDVGRWPNQAVVL